MLDPHNLSSQTDGHFIRVIGPLTGANEGFVYLMHNPLKYGDVPDNSWEDTSFVQFKTSGNAAVDAR